MKSKVCIYFMFSLIFLTPEITSAFELVPAKVAVYNYKCIDKEREALLHFKANIQDRFGRLSTWTRQEEDCCKWSRVTCNYHTGHVTELNLDLCFLGGEISPSLLNLTFLYNLDISVNYFNGPFPSFIGSMPQLRHLDLSVNQFNGYIPSFIGSMTQLSHLDLSFNQFNGIIPSFIGSITHLSHLDLSSNYFSGNIPRELGNLTNLQYLSLGDLDCAIENLDWMPHLTQLQVFDMSRTTLANANHWVNVISSLPKLSTLILYECELSQVMHPFSSSPNSSSSSSIVYLDLGGNNLNSSMNYWLFPLTSNTLEVLDLSNNMLDGIPKYLGNLCNLTSLYFNNNSMDVNFLDLLNNWSGCTSISVQLLYASHSRLTGSLSDEIQMFSSLEVLDLSDNQLNGTISEKVWELPKLQALDVSSNSVWGSISNNIGNSKPSYLEYFDLSSCKLGPRFPNWIQTIILKNLSRLDIANNGISDVVPVEFWNMWPSQLTYLNLSCNNFTGRVPNLESNFNLSYSGIDLSSNDFYGPIPNVPSTLATLDLSKNRFHGGIYFLCRISGGFLSYLDLSNNSLEGPIPDCLWHLKELKVLNLGHNNLFGRLPNSVGYLIKLKVLFLNNNYFCGEFPLSFKNCTSLNILYMGSNKFSGYVPFWIGEKLSGLYALSLTSNNFFGSIPSQLCQLEKLQILDLSMNGLNEAIPSCINNLTAMVENRFASYPNVNSYTWGNNRYGFAMSEYINHAMIKWQGIVREFSNTLILVKIIDLSSNNLTGQIPSELTNLYQLLSLNLSNNTLSGKIPPKIGEMKNLLTLDLSRNKLSGEIPSSMANMTLLSYLNVSYNNLSGRIPSSTQLQTFEPSRYTGNAGLCGLPLLNHCPVDKIEVPHVIGESEDNGDSIDELNRWFYIGGATGFPIGFFIVFGTLLFSRQGRHAFFVRFIGSMENWVYVKVTVRLAKFQRVAYT